MNILNETIAVQWNVSLDICYRYLPLIFVVPNTSVANPLLKTFYWDIIYMFDFTVDYDIRKVHHIMEKVFKFLDAFVKLLVLCSCSFPADTLCGYSDHLKLVDKTEGKFKKAHLFRVFSGC